MQRVSIDDPAWRTSFPHLVAPLPDEWIAGLLLRCDEVNRWDSGTTLRYLLRSTEDPGIGFRSSLIVFPPSILERLAQLLSVPFEYLLATTYHTELARLYLYDPHPRLLIGNQVGTRVLPLLVTERGVILGESKYGINTFAFHVCPACIAQARLLQRSLMLPYMKYCPLHHIAFCFECVCSWPLIPSFAEVRPFTCFACGLDWAHLPQDKTPLELMTLENRLYALYQFFLLEGTYERKIRALQLVRPTVRKQNLVDLRLIYRKSKYNQGFNMDAISLAYVVDLLLSVGISPDDIRADEILNP
jgi:TniQ protein